MPNLELQDCVKYWTDWYLSGLTNLGQRPGYFEKNHLSKDMARAYIGVRRSGKTSLACLVTQKHSSKTCYINFEDPFFLNNNEVDLLDLIPEAYRENYGKNFDFLILDEVQIINGWEKWLRKIIDTKRFAVIITGSSSELLSSELASALTGRCLETKVWPLSFSEYLKFKKFPEKKSLESKLLDYVNNGGFPQVALEKSTSQREEILRAYFQNIILKDIVARFSIREVSSLQAMLQYLLTNIASKHSFNSIKNAFSINVTTAQDYAFYAEAAFLFFFVKKYDRNLKVQARNPQKVYCVDTGLRQVNAFYHSLDIGKLIENVVFIELLRRNKQVYYHQANYEVDFLLCKADEVLEAINVCYSDLENPETYDREIRGMLECLKMHGLGSGTILSKSLNTVEIIEGRKIIFKPVLEFLLG